MELLHSKSIQYQIFTTCRLEIWILKECSLLLRGGKRPWSACISTYFRQLHWILMLTQFYIHRKSPNHFSCITTVYQYSQVTNNFQLKKWINKMPVFQSSHTTFLSLQATVCSGVLTVVRPCTCQFNPNTRITIASSSSCSTYHSLKSDWIIYKPASHTSYATPRVEH